MWCIGEIRDYVLSKNEFYVLVSAQKGVEETGKAVLEYAVTARSKKSSLDLTRLEEVFDSTDPSMRKGFTRVEPFMVVDAVRRFSELEFARVISKKLDEHSCIVIDGDLEPKITGELRRLDELKSSCADIGISVVGVSKTTTLMTEHGVPISKALSVLNQASVLSKWHYAPKIEGASLVYTSFVKLHERSQHVFRIDSFDNPADIKEVVSALSTNATDPVFFGYPFGLVEVDKWARISNQEKEFQRTKLISRMGVLWKEVEPYTSGSNAHSILDKIS